MDLPSLLPPQPLPTDQPVQDLQRSNPLLVAAADGPADAGFLRLRLAKALGGGRTSELVKTKHFYAYTDNGNGYPTSVNMVVPTSAHGAAVNLTAMVTGTGYNQRIGNAVRIHKVILRMRVRRDVLRDSSGGTNQLDVPIWGWCLLRDKVPAVPSNAPELFNKGSDPPVGIPSGATSPPVFDKLGSIETNAASVAVRNPITQELYDLHRLEFKDYTGDNTTYQTHLDQNGNGAPALHAMKYEHEIPIDKVCVFAQSTDVHPITNQIWFYCWSDTLKTNQNYNDIMLMTADVHFSDENVE